MREISMIMHWPPEQLDHFLQWCLLIERPLEENITPNICTERQLSNTFLYLCIT